jgi:hypothetical protein
MLIVCSHQFFHLKVEPQTTTTPTTTKKNNNQWWIMTIHPPARGSVQPLAEARAPRYHHQPVFFFFSWCYFFKSFSCIDTERERKREPEAVISYHARALVVFQLEIFSFPPPGLATLAHAVPHQQQHALTFIYIYIYLDGIYKIKPISSLLFFSLYKMWSIYRERELYCPGRVK